MIDLLVFSKSQDIYEILSRNSIEFAQINSFAAIVEGFLRNKLIKADKLIRVRHRNDVLLVLFSRLIILRILNPLRIIFYIKIASVAFLSKDVFLFIQSNVVFHHSSGQKVDRIQI